MTRSTSLSAERSEVAATRAKASSRSASVFLPFSICRLSDFSRAAMVASAVDWLRDRSTTSNPLTAAVSAMPEPMMPEPTIPTRAIDIARDASCGGPGAAPLVGLIQAEHRRTQLVDQVLGPGAFAIAPADRHHGGDERLIWPSRPAVDHGWTGRPRPRSRPSGPGPAASEEPADQGHQGGRRCEGRRRRAFPDEGSRHQQAVRCRAGRGRRSASWDRLEVTYRALLRPGFLAALGRWPDRRGRHGSRADPGGRTLAGRTSAPAHPLRPPPPDGQRALVTGAADPGPALSPSRSGAGAAWEAGCGGTGREGVEPQRAGLGRV